MNATNKNQSTSSQKSHVVDAASDLLHEGKKFANELYEEGVNKANSLYESGANKVSDAQDSVKEYSDQLLKKVQENPLASVLIAGGIGFVLSKILKK